MLNRTIIEKFNKSFDGKLAVISIAIITRWIWSSKKALKKVSLSQFSQRLLRIKFELCYEYYFKHLDFKRAYNNRLYHYILIVCGTLKGDVENAKNYLTVMNDADFYEYLGLDEKVKKFINNLTIVETTALFPTGSERRKLAKIIMSGPKSQPDEIDFSCYDLAVFNKLPPDNINMPSDKILIITGNYFIKNKFDNVNNWLKHHKHATVLTPMDIDERFITDVFDVIPNYLYASPMNLQRTLFALNYLYEVEELHVTGYDFFLSKQNKNEWYQKQVPEMPEFLNSKNEAVLISTMRHDYVFNILYCKKYFQQMDFAIGDTRDVCLRSIQDILPTFMKLYGNIPR